MEHSLYLKGLKSVLKASGLKYNDIAVHLNMTESGVKKMLNAKDISFRRMLQLCDLIGVKPSQVMSFSESNEKPVLTLTKNQEDSLLNSRELLVLFWRVAVEKLSTHEISLREKMKEADLRKSLSKLQQLGLLEKRDGEFYYKQQGLFKLDDNSKLALKLNREWSELTLKRSLSSKQRKLHRLLTLKTSEQGYEQVISKIEDCLKAIINESEQAMLSSKGDKLKNFSLLVASAHIGVLDSDI